jgi:hypothetical protein
MTKSYMTTEGAGTFTMRFVTFAKIELAKVLDDEKSRTQDKVNAIEQLIMAIIEERTGA